MTTILWTSSSLEVQKTGELDGLHFVPFNYHCVVGSFEVDYTCAWRVDEEYYQYCDEWLSLAGPLAELDWSDFDLDWK